MTAVKLLLVDDVPDNLVALTALLEPLAVECLTASTGEQALELLLVHDVALALLDVQMPGMDGFTLAEYMRGAERTRRIPIIFLTATLDVTRAFVGYEAGAVDFLYKPLDPQVLLAKVRVFVELHVQRQRLAEQIRLLDEHLHLTELFMAVLGHDLRTPLNVVISQAQVLQRQATDPMILKGVERISRSGERMLTMVNDLLDLARTRSGQGLPVQCAACDSAVVVRRAVDEQDPKQARVRTEFRGDTQGTWDADRLMQAVTNLLANAFQHGEADAPIGVVIDGSDLSRVRLQVTNGGFIPEAERRTLFEPYRRGRRPGGDTRGLGLGLYIVQQICEAHGGSISVSSSAESHSTTFTIVLPREPVQPQGLESRARAGSLEAT
ncbi:MAG: hybrid sensor histidine kinase/response regulator [Acidobacteria bacterium]|nr:hybrid sensor histidine kinase/response regulator [Acidobacteriota bacterium]